MGSLRQAMEKEYLTMASPSLENSSCKMAGLRLKDFISFMEERRARRIRPSALALTSARGGGKGESQRDLQPVIWAQRLGVVRDFARYLSAFEPRTEVPPAELLPHRYRRRAPYLYTDQEIQKILAATLELYPPSGLGRWTYHTLIGLLSAPGMRPGEALNLELQDVDLKECISTVRGSKFGKSRWVVIHSVHSGCSVAIPATSRALRGWTRQNACLSDDTRYQSA